MTTELKINGYKLMVNAVSPLAPKAIELQYKKKNPEPVQPTYSVDAVGGVTETFKHTADSVETDEEKQALAEWKEKHGVWMSGLTYKLLRLFLSQGVKVKLTDKQKENFDVQLQILEIDVPENSSERDLLYLETFIIDDQEGMQQVIEAVLAETGINQEALDTANATFRA